MTGATSLHMDVMVAPGTAVASSPPLTVASHFLTCRCKDRDHRDLPARGDVVAAVGAVLARGVAYRRPVLTYLAEQAA